MNKTSQETNKALPVRENTCYHCGDKLQSSGIRVEEKEFCCEGCKLVFSILSDTKMEAFYQLNKQAGVSQKDKPLKNRYEYLDDDEILESLTDFRDETTTVVNFKLPQIHCSSCLWLLENLYRIEPAIYYSRIDFLKKEAEISFSTQKFSIKSLAILLDNIGYPPTLDLSVTEKKTKETKPENKLFYKLGLAGFVFGNVMLFSFPEYLGLEKSSFSQFFSYLNLLLIIPVLSFSAQDYLKSAYLGLKHKILNIDVPISLGMIALFGLSAYEILINSGSGYIDSLAGLIFFLLIAKWFQHYTYKQFNFENDYTAYFPVFCSILKDDKESKISLRKLKVKDIIYVRNGELIPADGIVLDGEARIDYSFVTGEQALVHKAKGDKLYAGGRQMHGLLKLKVTRLLKNSRLTQLWNAPAFDKRPSVPISNTANNLAFYFTIIILIIAFMTLFYWMRFDLSKAAYAYTSVLIIACPCAVALSIPFTFGNIMRILIKNNIYLKNIEMVEVLSKITDLVFDKTGTLTDQKSRQVVFDGSPLNTVEKEAIYSLVQHSAHPWSQSISKSLIGNKIRQVSSFKAHQSVGLEGVIKQSAYSLKSNASSEKDFAPKAKGIQLEINGDIRGTFLKQSTYRDGIKKLIRHLQKKYNVFLLSGDSNHSMEYFKDIFGTERALHYDMLPEDKLNFIAKLQQDGSTVAMIGDGLNDAGALKQSEIGIVVSEDVSNFIPACDIIISAKMLHKMEDILCLSKQSIKIIYCAYFLALSYNAIGLFYAVQGILSPIIAAILMPLSSITVLLFSMIASTFVARKYGFQTGYYNDDKNHIRP